MSFTKILIIKMFVKDSSIDKIYLHHFLSTVNILWHIGNYGICKDPMDNVKRSRNINQDNLARNLNFPGGGVGPHPHPPILFKINNV